MQEMPTIVNKSLTSKRKGKKRAVKPPIKDQPEDTEVEIIVAKQPPPVVEVTKTIKDLNLDQIVGEVSQGKPAKENAAASEKLLTALGRRGVVTSLQENPVVIAGPNTDPIRLDETVISLTNQPQGKITTETACLQCDAAKATCKKGKKNSTRCDRCGTMQLKCSFTNYFTDYVAGLNQSFVQSLASPLALQFQARSIMELLIQSH
ncbi:hypothetical protein MPER_02833, partial [Moniliophthora perniciosa FA553]